jgi:hypothetical protein
VARLCKRCGLPLNAETHDVVRTGPLESFPFVGFKAGQRQKLTYVRRPRKVVYGCRVQLTADADLGGTFTPHVTQRGAQVGQAHPVGAATTSYRRKELIT